MTAIKKLIDGSGNQYFPQTHTKAVVDDNGYSVESRMQAVQDVVNQAQMDIGAVPNDLTPTEGSTNWVTSGGVYKALNTDTVVELVNEKSLALTNDGKWRTTSGVTHYQVPITAGTTYKILANASNYTRIYWCTSAATPVSGNTIPFCSGETGMHYTAANSYNTFTAPSDANYMYVDGGTLAPQGVWEVTSIKERIANVETEVSSVQEDIFNTAYTMSGEVAVTAHENGKAIKASNGVRENISGKSYTNYTPTYEAQKIYVYAHGLYSMTYGLAFYTREADASFISGVYFANASSEWKMIDVPENAHFFRYTLITGQTSSFRYVMASDNMMNILKASVDGMITTHIMRSAVPVSEKRFKYAFGMSQMYIVGSKAYVGYAGNESTLDGDSVGYPNEGCCAEVDLFDLSVTTLHPTNGSIKYSDDTVATGTIGYSSPTKTPDNKVASLALLRQNNNNPYYCYSICEIPTFERNWVTCRLSYDVSGTSHDVDFTINNYRQMLTDVGYASSYVASTKDCVDNINLHYDSVGGKYYAVICGAQSSSQTTMPIVLMESSDMATWTPRACVGNGDASEIEAIYKDGIAYVVYRTIGHGMKYVIYDVTNSQTLNSGSFSVDPNLLSKPDVFTFRSGVFMAVNVDPSVFGEILGYNSYGLDARSEIAIYEIVNNAPVFFRRVCNPTGINYFSFCETPPMYATSSSTTPMRAQGAIYMGFSEDRRHLYRRQIAQMSFVDATPLFANYLKASIQ